MDDSPSDSFLVPTIVFCESTQVLLESVVEGLLSSGVGVVRVIVRSNGFSNPSLYIRLPGDLVHLVTTAYRRTASQSRATLLVSVAPSNRGNYPPGFLSRFTLNCFNTTQPGGQRRIEPPSRYHYPIESKSSLSNALCSVVCL